MSAATSTRWRDAAWLGLGLLLVLAWDLAGLDRALSALAGGSAGFPLRAAGSWASRLHEAGRWASGVALAVLLLDAAWPGAPWRADAARTPAASAARRWTALATVLVLAAVPAIKRVSGTSCPWDVADFGGSVPYVPHLLWTVLDGGPGHCFPSGHAVSAFAFLVPVLAWRRRRPRAAAWALAAVLAFGLLSGAVQVLRGAHYVSHVLWSAWLCWALALAAAAGGDLALGRRSRADHPRAPSADAGVCPDIELLPAPVVSTQPFRRPS